MERACEHPSPNPSPSPSPSPASTDLDYVQLYRQSPEKLKLVDRELRSRLTITEYHQRYKGYFLYEQFHPEVGDLSSKINVFTYGLLSGYNWEHTVACGRGIWAIAKGQNHDMEHIYLAIYSKSYRVIRAQLQHLFDILPKAVSITLTEGIIVITILGMVRKICLYVDYNESPFWIIYRPKSYFNTYGTLYHPNIGVQMTVNALVNNKTPSFKELPDLDRVLGYKHQVTSYNEPPFLLNNIYPEYKLIVRVYDHEYGEQIADRVGQIIDVELITADTVDIRLISTHGVVYISQTSESVDDIYKEVCKVVYVQPLALLSRTA